MNLVETVEVDEKYSRDTLAFQSYMGSPAFDPYACWYNICNWMEENDQLDIVSAAIGQDVSSAHDLMEIDADVWERLPETLRKACAQDVEEEIMQNDPEEASTHQHMMLARDKVLPNQTWLIHFSDEAQSIAHEGFTRGIDQMDRLGLTTYFGDHAKEYGGYNFAFVANGRYSLRGARYGRDAVMFQNSGVLVHHHADEEDQVVFHGTDVDPREIVLLRQIEGEWMVMNRRARPGQRRWLVKGELKDCIGWVMRHVHSYRGTATTR